jgi:uncharacterized protein (TIGR03790 family)
LIALGLAATTAAEPSGAPVADHSFSFGARRLAVVINTADPLSVAIGKYYAQQRRIPNTNIVRIAFDPQRDSLSAAEFSILERNIDRQLNPGVQGYALTWARPYRVGCTSITAAFAFGRVSENCADGCRYTTLNPYFNTFDVKPYDRFKLRPAMSLAAVDFAGAKALIDRGVRSDGSFPTGTAYLVTTNDVARNVRAAEYPLADRVAGHEFSFHVATGAATPGAQGVMFYFTGAASVDDIAALKFLPGAVADHLTSFGGMLTDSPQMSSLRWLQMGATGSYGTVVEPCNVLGKFPNVAVLLAHYLAGETLLEAYWKSVQMPSQGIFIGEPLAAPFRHR